MSVFSGFTRRRALAAIGSLAAAPMLNAQELIGEPPGRIAPLGELVNLTEFEPMAKRKLDAATFATIAGGNRSDFDRITFRPKLMIDASKLDLSCELFGQTMFAPIIMGPASFQGKIHPDGELASMRGVSAAKASMVVSSLSSHPLEKIVAEAKTPFWYQVFPGADAKAKAQEAVKLGCKALVITVGVPAAVAAGKSTVASKSNPAPDWAAIDKIRQGMTVPVVIKGVVSPEEAEAATKHGAQGVIVSNWGGNYPRGTTSPLMAVSAIADAVGGKIPVLVDGSFRRGTDILKALVMGANAVLLTRPPLWGLAAYGMPGVQAVMEMSQTELARNTAMLGAPNLKSFTRNMIKIHAKAS